MSVPTTTLPGGDEMPLVGLGTWNLDAETVGPAIDAALGAGYTHIDTAEGYHNEAAIGEAIAGQDRDELFLTSKVLPKHLHYEGVIAACEASLDRLGTDYLDLYLVHWPNPAVSIRETMQAMARLRERGLVRNVGVSNFSRYQLSCARHVADVPVAVNQIEYHPWYQQPALVEYCQANDVVVEAAAPLARTDVLEDEALQSVARTSDRSPAQVALRWAVENDVVVLPKSSNPEHVRENGDLFDWELDEADRERIDDRDRDHAVYADGPLDWTADVYGIAE